MRSRAFWWLALGLLALLTSLTLTRNVDFRVYWFGLHGFYSGSQPAYGPTSGLGFPMHYRYPPVTYLLLWPLRFGSLRTDGVLWMLGIWAATAAVARLAVNRLQLQISQLCLLALAAFLLPYAVLTIRSGNIQAFLIAMIFAAVLLSSDRPRLAACLLAGAITFKVWPVFFLPWFLRPNRQAVLKWLGPALVVLWLFPLLVWTPAHYADLIRQWFENEWQASVTASEIWYFPGQSLRGVLLRYLTALPAGIANFPDLHVFSFSPSAVVSVWKIASVSAYGVAGFLLLRSRAASAYIWDGFAFVLFTVLEPYCLKSSMISLAPAALIAAHLASRNTPNSIPGNARRFFFAACALSFLTALLQTRFLVHLLLALGVDFGVSVLLLISLCLYIRTAESPTNI